MFYLLLVLAMSLAGCNGDEPAIDMSKVVTDTNALPVNLVAEVARARSENKLLVLEFASSDSCPPCIRLQQNVFSTPEFKQFAASNMDFVRLDFPLKSDLRPDTTATNTLLSQQFDVDVFPTFVALDKNGKEFWRAPKNLDDDPVFDQLFDPTNFINTMKSLKQKEQ